MGPTPLPALGMQASPRPGPAEPNCHGFSQYFFRGALSPGPQAQVRHCRPLQAVSQALAKLPA